MHTERVEKSFYGDFHLKLPFFFLQSQFIQIFDFSFFVFRSSVKSVNNKNKISSFSLSPGVSILYRDFTVAANVEFSFTKFFSQFELFSQET